MPMDLTNQRRAEIEDERNRGVVRSLLDRLLVPLSAFPGNRGYSDRGVVRESPIPPIPLSENKLGSAGGISSISPSLGKIPVTGVVPASAEAIIDRLLKQEALDVIARQRAARERDFPFEGMQ